MFHRRISVLNDKQPGKKPVNPIKYGRIGETISRLGNEKNQQQNSCDNSKNEIEMGKAKKKTRSAAADRRNAQFVVEFVDDEEKRNRKPRRNTASSRKLGKTQ